MSTRASTARHVRQRKLNTKQPLRIIREDEIEDVLDEEVQRQIHQVETGVEKGEEVEFHLQAVINAHNAAALGAKASSKSSYIPTPDATQAKDVDYDALYPKVFRQPATYIRFSSTIEDCVGVAYCMDEDDAEFLAKLNDGKDFNGFSLKGKLGQCSEDRFEEVMTFFEETSQRLQPFATVDNAPILSLEELEAATDEDAEPVSAEAQKFLPPIYAYWVSRKAARSQPLMPAIKVRLLDTTSEADDADPYVCFRRREVRQTRKTRGRDAQIVEKLKKLRLELEQARSLVQLVRRREELQASQLTLGRKVFDERRKLKAVKASKGIKSEVGGEDELLLVNQKPVVPKLKTTNNAASRGQDSAATPGGNSAQSGQQRPATIRLRSLADRPSASEDSSLNLLADAQAEAEAYVTRAIESRKEQHRRWNQHWHDRTWHPITPPPELADEPRSKWASLQLPEAAGYPTPPPSQKAESPVDREGDVEMQDAEEEEDRKPSKESLEKAGGGGGGGDGDNIPSAAPPRLHLIKAFSATTTDPDDAMDHTSSATFFKSPRQVVDHAPPPQCRIRYGRGGRRYLEARPRPRQAQARAILRSGAGVVSDSDSDDDMPDYTPVQDYKIFEYRTMMNRGSATAAPPQQPPGGGRLNSSGGGGESAVAAGPQQASPAQAQAATPSAAG